MCVIDITHHSPLCSSPLFSPLSSLTPPPLLSARHCFPSLQIVEEAKHKGEAGLTDKQEKVQIEIEKVLRRVEEFEEYGDVDAIPQYVKDLQSVQKRVAEVQDQTVTINKVSSFHIT